MKVAIYRTTPAKFKICYHPLEYYRTNERRDWHCACAPCAHSHGDHPKNRGKKKKKKKKKREKVIQDSILCQWSQIKYIF
ncbi:hypothetical protein XELAEV_18031305mg [Xenopus laevis]|uniref:Uncharacterized protein n=1 Tax=Xenopus laevis TaxID=8355 RepID=A0A974CMV0_XENLA|nr:hypothetical protein XELAEV_18031305mg [Xenopus laevis]